MYGVAMLLTAAALAHALARGLRVPPIPLLLLGGFGLSLVAAPPADVLEDALLLGVAFLLFVVGLELDPRRVRAQRTAAVRVGLVQFAVLAGLGWVVATALGFAFLEASYLAMALTASSTLVCVRLLQRRRQMFEPFGRLVLGVLLLQDLIVLLAIPLLAEVTEGWLPALGGVAGVALLGGMSLLARWVVGRLLPRVADESELVLLGSLATLFLFLAAADFLGLPLVVGAFLAGVAFAGFPVNGIVRSELAPVGDFFGAIFFTALGALVGLPSLLELFQAGVLALVVLVATPPLVAAVAERSGFSAKAAFEAGLLLSQTSEISLVIGLSGMIQGLIGEEVFTVIALVTGATMLLTPFLATDRVAWKLVALQPLRRQEPAEPPSGHVLMLGSGATGMPLLEDLILTGCDVVVVDDDPAVIARLRDADVRTIRGDASDPDVLRHAGVGRARLVSSTIRRPRDNAALLELAAATVPVLVRVFDPADADWVRERGGHPVLYSEATAENLIAWFRQSLPELEQRLADRVPAAAR